MWMVDEMTELKVIQKQTKELSSQEIKDLISLKQQYWGYSDEDQISWMKKNIMENDNHILIYQGELLAYLNAVNVDVYINQSLHQLIGIGNVCVDKKYLHTGMGSIAMSYINAFIKKSFTCGVLLCKCDLVPFYEASNWLVVNSHHITIKDKLFEHVLMIYDPSKVLVLDKKDVISLSRNF